MYFLGKSYYQLTKLSGRTMLSRPLILMKPSKLSNWTSRLLVIVLKCHRVRH
jgi:hypothetical protein